MQPVTTAIPWFEPQLDADDIEAVRAAAASGFVNEGPANRAFEADLRTFFDVPYAVTTPSGTTALALALMAHGIGPGDHVLIPAVTFIGTASAVRLAGATVRFADVDPDTFVMRTDVLDRYGHPSLKAVMPVHLTGRAVDMDPLNAWAAERGLVVIEDAAEALGGRNASGWLGTQSHAGCFSLAPTKIITSGQGGFVLTRDRATCEQLVRLRDHGRLSRASDEHPVTGYNFKVTDLQAALARSQWRKLPARIARVKAIDTLYQEALADCPQLHFPARPPHGYLMWPDFTSPVRDWVVQAMRARNITLRPYWPALHLQPAYRMAADLPGAERACQEACWLPCAPAITDDQVIQVADHLRDILGSIRL